MQIFIFHTIKQNRRRRKHVLPYKINLNQHLTNGNISTKLNKVMKDISKANFLKINLEKPQNYEHAQSLDLSKPRIVILGGENTTICNLAYNYCISIAKTLHLNGITSGLNIYSAYYKTNSRDTHLDRLSLFADFYGQKNLVARQHQVTPGDSYYIEDYFNTLGIYPNYVNDVFNFVFLPQLISRIGQPVGFKKAYANMGNTIIYTHCHGTYVLRLCEKIMREDHMNGDYSETEMNALQKNLLAVNYAPFAPLNNWRFSALSFGSASDDTIHYYNRFDYCMKALPQMFKPAFYDYKFGNIMIADQVKKDPALEHSDVGLSGSEDVNERLTQNGKILFASERNVLLSGVRAMLAGEPIPEIPDMIGTQYASYTQLKRQASKILHHFNIKSL